MNIPMSVRYYMAEFFGSFLIFFLGMGTYILTENALLGALALGGSYLIAAMTLQHISQAHFNPVITFAAWLDGRLPMKTLWIYLFGQVSGTLFGVLSLFLFDLPSTPVVAYDWFSLSTYTLEMFFAFILVYVYLAVSEQTDRRAFLGLAVGMSYTLIALMAGYMAEGGLLHPLRFIETGILHGDFSLLQILALWFSLEVGALLAALFYKYLKFQNTPHQS